MREKRKKRARRLPPKPVTEENSSPLANLDSQQRKSSHDAEAEASQKVVNDDGDDGAVKAAANTKARQLLESQRASVAALTAVRQAVEERLGGVPANDEAVRAALDRQGYWYIDDFLMEGDDAVDAIREEGMALLRQEDGGSNVTRDDDAVISSPGEFTCRIEGGANQYQICPRTVEMVVSLTKHVPEHLQLLSSRPDERISSTGCVATMRIFDRDVWEASLRLLAGGDADEVTTATEEWQPPPRPFQRLVTDPATDLRRLSLYYYAVPEGWDDLCGGGLTFEKTGETVSAKRNRLVIFRPDAASVRLEAWRGSPDLRHASCVELHLVQQEPSTSR